MRKGTVVAAVTTVATVVAVAVLVRQWKKRSDRRWRHAQRIVRKFARECATPVPKLWHIANDLISHMKAGLGLALPNNHTMLPSYVHPLPTGY